MRFAFDVSFRSEQGTNAPAHAHSRDCILFAAGFQADFSIMDELLTPVAIIPARIWNQGKAQPPTIEMQYATEILQPFNHSRHSRFSNALSVIRERRRVWCPIIRLLAQSRAAVSSAQYCDSEDRFQVE